MKEVYRYYAAVVDIFDTGVAAADDDDDDDDGGGKAWISSLRPTPVRSPTPVDPVSR